MVTSMSRLAYSDCFELLEKAIDDPKGIRVKFASYEDAYHFRLRVHTARKIDRVDNMEIYQPGDQMFGRSVYDGLTMKIKRLNGKDWRDGAWLNMERIDAREFELESLASVEEVPLQPPSPVMIQIVPKDLPQTHMMEPIPRKRRL